MQNKYLEEQSQKLNWVKEKDFVHIYKVGEIQSMGPVIGKDNAPTGKVMKTEITEVSEGGYKLTRFISVEKATYDFKEGVTLIK
jgi:hypothetical protein